MFDCDITFLKLGWPIATGEAYFAVYDLPILHGCNFATVQNGETYETPNPSRRSVPRESAYAAFTSASARPESASTCAKPARISSMPTNAARSSTFDTLGDDSPPWMRFTGWSR